MASSIKERSRKKGCDFNLTKDWVLERLVYGRCEVSGIKFNHKPVRWNRFKPSIDRKNSQKGYTQDNCQVVILQYNIGKGCWSDIEYLKMCQQVVENSRRPRFSDPEKHLILKLGRKAPPPSRPVFSTKNLSMTRPSRRSAQIPEPTRTPLNYDFTNHDELYS